MQLPGLERAADKNAALSLAGEWIKPGELQGKSGEKNLIRGAALRRGLILYLGKLRNSYYNCRSSTYR